MAKCANRRTGIVVAALAAVGLLAMPASVEASLYIWNVDANGSWTTASNWLYAGGGPNTGYPNAPGDQAFFTAEYTAARTVTIPAGFTPPRRHGVACKVSVGRIEKTARGCGSLVVRSAQTEPDSDPIECSLVRFIACVRKQRPASATQTTTSRDFSKGFVRRNHKPKNDS